MAWQLDHKAYPLDFAGVAYEGPPTPARLNALPLLVWLHRFVNWCKLHKDELHMVLALGHDEAGEPIPGYDWSILSARAHYGDTYLKSLFENRLSPMVWNEVAELPHAADIYWALKKV